jgi:hypothetical protein
MDSSQESSKKLTSVTWGVMPPAWIRAIEYVLLQVNQGRGVVSYSQDGGFLFFAPDHTDKAIHQVLTNVDKMWLYFQPEVISVEIAQGPHQAN